MLLCLEDDFSLLCNVFVLGISFFSNGGVWMVGSYGVLDCFDLKIGRIE